MIFKPEMTEALDITKHMLAALINFNISSDDAGADLRSAVGKLMGNFYGLTANQALGPELLDCFEAARAAGATLDSMDGVREAMLAEAPRYAYGISLVNAAVLFSLSEQGQIIAVMTFASRSEVDVLIERMTAVFEGIKLGLSDSFTASDYQNMVALSAALIQHLSATERQLPRIVNYQMPINYPALALANRIYADGSRSDELIAENETVHPAFMQRDVIALSE